MASHSYIKWLGDKTKLGAVIRSHMPEKYAAHIEPFAGSGALFFETLPQCAVLADTNERLVRTHIAVRDKPELVIDLLRTYRNDPDFYYSMRDNWRAVDAASDVDVAACMIYWSKTAHGGIYRVNGKNEFNVPFGKYKSPRFCDAEKIRACSAALQGVSIDCASFETTMLRAEEGDFIYADPPYAKLDTASFVGYTADGFSGKQHQLLRDLAVELARRGVFVLISNADAPGVRELYRGNGFRIEEVKVRRNIAVKGRDRGVVSELLISNYPSRRGSLKMTGT